jgi:disulfide bond formation protein DsbB
MIVSPRPSRTLNSFGLLVVCGLLIGAYFFQFTMYELPCPLCLLQRVAFVAVGYGLALNLIYGAKPHHYGIMLLAASFGASVSIRQIMLHIVPGTGHYGSAVLGLHYYTWAGIAFFMVILGTSVMLLQAGQVFFLPAVRPGGRKCGYDPAGMRSLDLRRPADRLQAAGGAQDGVTLGRCQALEKAASRAGKTLLSLTRLASS